MNQVQSAALMLLGTTATLLLLGWFIWRRRRPPVSRPAVAGGSGLTRFSRKRRAVEVDIAMLPERLARISGKRPTHARPDDSSDADVGEAGMTAATAPEAAVRDAILETAVAEVEQQADAIVATPPAEGVVPATPDAAAVAVRLVPQIPIGDSGAANSWLGGRPRLLDGAAWPQVEGEAGDFLAQISCADLPDDLWADAGPRKGWLALFVHPHHQDVQVLYVPALGAPMEPPRPIAAADGRLGPHDIAPDSDLMRFVRPAFPEWPVDLIMVKSGAPDPRAEGEARSVQEMYEAGYDIADPAFHPFDWDSMLAMVAILEQSLSVIAPDYKGDGLLGADDANEGAAAAIMMNREARARAEEIIAIVRETASVEEFSPAGAAAVMDALRSIRWTNQSGAAEGKILSLTEHHADADLWVHDYQRIHFDHAKHDYCAAAPKLSVAARARYEPLWQDLAAHRMASIDIAELADDDDSNAMCIELPTNGLMSWRFGDGAKLMLTLPNDAWATGDFSGVQAQICN